MGVIEFFGCEAPSLGWLIEVATDLGGRLGSRARKQAEQALRESEARFRSLTELSSDWYWEQDAQYRFTMMSRGIDSSIGVQPGDFIGKKRWDAHTAGISAEQWAEHKAALDAREPFRDLVYGCFDAAGNVRYLSTSGHPVFDGQGNFRGYRGVGKDVTERIKAGRAARNPRQPQTQGTSSPVPTPSWNSSFMSPRTTCRSRCGWWQAIRNCCCGAMATGSAATPGSSWITGDGAARMKQLIEICSLFAGGNLRQGVRWVPWEAVLRKALANLKIAIEQRRERHNDALPEVVVDDVRMQLFQNLIGNAVKFRGEQPPAVQA